MSAIPNHGAVCNYCSDTAVQLRRRTIANGSFQFAEQCVTCGRMRSNAIKASLVMHPETTPPWDNELANAYEAVRAAQYKQEHSEWLIEHDAYLKSREWREKRSLVMKRAGAMCEGCGTNRATQVHHRTYDHWKKEFLWELVAICDECHDRVHDENESH